MSAPTEAALWRAIGPAPMHATTTPAYMFAENGTGDVTLRAITPGVCRGQLTGGNISVLAGLLGTPFEIDTAGRVLFLEDVDEPVYRVDRYLAQLKLAGKLESVVGAVLGSFTFEAGAEPGADCRARRIVCPLSR